MAIELIFDENFTQFLFQIFRANITILGALIKNASFNSDIDAATLILTYAMREGIKPNERFCTMIGGFKNRLYNRLQSNESSENENQKFNKLYAVYKDWRNMFELNTTDLREDRPWKQYKDSCQTGIEEMKNPYIRRLWKKTHALRKLNPTYLKRIHETETNDASTEKKVDNAKIAIDE